MFLFEGLLKEVCDEGNSGELDGTMNGGKTRVERERERENTNVLGSQGGVSNDVRVSGI